MFCRTEDSGALIAVLGRDDDLLCPTVLAFTITLFCLHSFDERRFAVKVYMEVFAVLIKKIMIARSRYRPV
jgi:hypothetical protein